MRACLLVLALSACRSDSQVIEKSEPEETDSGSTPGDSAPEVVDADGDGSPEGEDCDDADETVHPGADERCDGVDQDCDEAIDEDATDTSTWFADADGDGHGDPTRSDEACLPAQGFVAEGDDCDDADAAVWSAGEEVWYNGADDACDGGDDFDQDGDGDPIPGGGGTDCDDTDPGVDGDDGCRPAAPCAHPSAATLQAWAPAGASDLAFDAECRAYVSTIISGLDYVYVIDETGIVGIYPGTADYDIGAVSVDDAGTFVVGWSEGVLGVGVESGASIASIYTRGMAFGSHWTNGYLNHAPSSIVSDGSCVWVPQIGGDGTVGCVTYAGTLGVVASPGRWVESVALDSEGTLWASVEGDLLVVDSTTGETSLAVTLDEAVLDMAFDYNDDLYVQLTTGEIVVVDHATHAVSSYDASSTSQGKLAIAPDGVLVRLVAAPVGAGTFGEWTLP